jgi:hypothetical protein
MQAPSTAGDWYVTQTPTRTIARISQRTGREEAMGKIIRIGEDVEGYAVPVLNEREIRASAGMLFLAMLLSYLLIIFEGNFLLIKYVITIFFADMTIRVCVNPGFSPSLIIGRLIVRNQTPEYVGQDKRGSHGQ